MSSQLDPEIAALLGMDSKPEAEESASVEKPIKLYEALEFQEESDSDHAKEVMKGLPTSVVEPFVRNLETYLQTTDKEQKLTMRQRLTTGFWGIYGEISKQLAKGSLSNPKREFLRYGLVNQKFVGGDLLKRIRASFGAAQTGNAVYYMDQWLESVGKGSIPPSSTDEVAQGSGRKSSANERLEKQKANLEVEVRTAQKRWETIAKAEEEIENATKMALERPIWSRGEEYGFKVCLDSAQRNALMQMTEAIKDLLREDKNIQKNYDTIEELDQALQELEVAVQAEAEQNDSADASLILLEFSSVRQMVKMTIGRQGNHFPLLFKDHLSDDSSNWATEENVMKVVTDIEANDPGVFRRTYRGEDHRIMPFFIIVPGYGNEGVCWEPFSRTARATSRSRIAIPIAPRDLKSAILSALGDLRWQVAKEKAQHYWMEEGLTGYYYEYFTKEKLKGDIKTAFMEDYTKWIVYESQGIQKLHKDVRPIFWRYTPFPQAIKESLKNRGFYYSELYKKDENIARSDGY